MGFAIGVIPPGLAAEAPAKMQTIMADAKPRKHPKLSKLWTKANLALILIDVLSSAGKPDVQLHNQPPETDAAPFWESRCFRWNPLVRREMAPNGLGWNKLHPIQDVTAILGDLVRNRKKHPEAGSSPNAARRGLGVNLELAGRSESVVRPLAIGLLQDQKNHRIPGERPGILAQRT